MFAQCLTIGSAMLIKEVDVNGEWVLAAYSYTDSDGKEHTAPFKPYDLHFNSDLEQYFFEYSGESYYLDDFHNAYGYTAQESQ